MLTKKPAACLGLLAVTFVVAAALEAYREIKEEERLKTAKAEHEYAHRFVMIRYDLRDPGSKYDHHDWARDFNLGRMAFYFRDDPVGMGALIEHAEKPRG